MFQSIPTSFFFQPKFTQELDTSPPDAQVCSVLRPSNIYPMQITHERSSRLPPISWPLKPGTDRFLQAGSQSCRASLMEQCELSLVTYVEDIAGRNRFSDIGP